MLLSYLHGVQDEITHSKCARSLDLSPLILHRLRLWSCGIITSSVRDLHESFVKLFCHFIDEEAKKGPKRRGAPRSAGRAAANTGPVSVETLLDLIRRNVIIAIYSSI